MGTVPILGTDPCPYYIHFNQGSESESEPMEKAAVYRNLCPSPSPNPNPSLAME